MNAKQETMKQSLNRVVLLLMMLVLSSFVKDRTVVNIKVCRKDVLLFRSDTLDINRLTDTLKAIIADDSDTMDVGEKVEKDVPCFGVTKVSKLIISIACENEANYAFYLSVQNEIERAFVELRQELSVDKFGQNYRSLSGNEKACIDAVYPKVISEAEPN